MVKDLEVILSSLCVCVFRVRKVSGHLERVETRGDESLKVELSAELQSCTHNHSQLTFYTSQTKRHNMILGPLPNP